MKRLFWSLFLCVGLLIPGSSFAQTATTKDSGVEEKGMEYLLFEDIPVVMGTLTQTDANKSPVSITVIDKEKLEITPARNLYDILSVYVPGFSAMSHFDSTHMSMRGLAVDRDYNFIILVNGRMMNQRSHDGAITELENWDLSDIEKVEVVRGPGSVTYGPGAVAGVISITTKNAKTSPGLSAGVRYQEGYNSEGGYLSEGLNKENYSLYLYGSCNTTSGYERQTMFNIVPSNPSAGYVHGDKIKLYRDYDDQPQVKLYSEFDLFKEWKLWARYVNSGTTRMNTWSDPGWFTPQNSPGFGYNDFPASAVKSAVGSIEDNHVFNEKFELNSSLSYSSIDNRRIDNGPGFAGNYAEDYAENELILKSLLHYNYSDTLKTAFGAEYYYDTLGLGWDRDKNAMIINDGVVYLWAPGTAAFNYSNHSWYTNIYTHSVYTRNYAVLGEISKTLGQGWELTFSDRMDKYDPTGFLFSPRVAITRDAGDYGIYKLTWQKSLRANTLVEVAADSANGSKSKFEQLQGPEFMYSNTFFKHLTTDLSVYYDTVNLLGWTMTTTTSGTVPQGNMSLAGVEGEIKYKGDNDRYEIGINHAYSKQLSFKLLAGQTSSYFSVTDARNTTTGDEIGIGSDRMNYADNRTKLYTIFRPWDKLTIFSDMKICWGYEGDKDWLIENLNQATGATAQALQAEINAAKKAGIFKPTFAMDLSVKYKFSPKWSVTLYGQNIAKYNHAWQLAYTQLAETATEDPTTFGMHIDYKF